MAIILLKKLRTTHDSGYQYIECLTDEETVQSDVIEFDKILSNIRVMKIDADKSYFRILIDEKDTTKKMRARNYGGSCELYYNN